MLLGTNWTHFIFENNKKPLIFVISNISIYFVA